MAEWEASWIRSRGADLDVVRAPLVGAALVSSILVCWGHWSERINAPTYSLKLNAVTPHVALQKMR